MTAFPIGTMVRMTSAFRRQLRASGSRAHASEFGGRAGVVLCPVDFGNGVRGPELDVRWIPGGLRYAYAPWELERSRKKVRGARNKKKLRSVLREAEAWAAVLRLRRFKHVQEILVS